MKVIRRLLELQELELGPKAEAPESRRLAETIRKELPENVVGHYDRLRAKGKKGVTLVRHGVCSGCQMRLASGVYATLMRNEDITMCDNCGRYLMITPEELPHVGTAPPAVAPSPPANEKPPGKKRGRKPKGGGAGGRG